MCYLGAYSGAVSFELLPLFHYYSLNETAPYGQGLFTGATRPAVETNFRKQKQCVKREGAYSGQYSVKALIYWITTRALQ